MNHQDDSGDEDEEGPDKPQSSDHQTNKSQPSMAYLPLEVITDIIARLPVKSLLRLRSVAKRWRSLIDSPEFVSLHIARSSAARSNLSLLLRRNSLLFTADHDAGLASAADLPHPLMCYSNEIKVLGSCNGLLCLCNVADDIAIWNPATRSHRLVPYLPSDRPRLRSEPSASASSFRGPRVYGFGYDPAGDDYILVRISQFIGLDCASYESEVRVFSARSNEWKALGDMPYALCYTKKMGVYVAGLLHWVVIRRLEPDAAGIIVAMDFVAETYRECPLPDDEGPGKWDQIDLGALDGRLSFVAGYGDVCFDVWVMREYGVRESWTRLARLAEGFGSCKLVRPLTYSKSGAEILFEQDHRKLFWYEPKSQRVRRLEIPHAPEVFEAFVCLNSLAPVTPRSRASGGRNSESNDDNNKQRDNFLSEGFKLVL